MERGVAPSICVKCGKGSFEIAEYAPFGSPVKIHLLQCASCGGVVGMADKRVLGELRDIEQKIDKVQSSVNRLD
jgi:ribosomal protein S27AE